jgi:pyridoxal phosphate enzyme (YggS family)|tara:strand:+ start:435 stop:1163 length:729 start_codon:yes stop_codon:yes gene_type:complete
VIEITEHLNSLNLQISKALKASGRPHGTIVLLAVSKKHDISAIRVAAANGLTDFGENYVSEAVSKIQQADFPAKWHFIGRIQSNKTREIATHFDWAQTLDRIKIAQRLNEQRPAALPPLQVLIQVQIDPEDQHGGIEPDAISELAAQIAKLPQLKLRGLMCIPKACEGKEAQRLPFKHMQQLFAELRQLHPDIDTLSMGMSNDLEAAILEGSTMVRIGTALFGSRNQSPPENEPDNQHGSKQ